MDLPPHSLSFSLPSHLAPGQAENLKKEAEAAKAREGVREWQNEIFSYVCIRLMAMVLTSLGTLLHHEQVRYIEGARALKKARIMRQPGYLQLANDPSPEEVCDQALSAWRDLREAVGLRSTMACEEWNTYELAQKAPRRPAKKGVPPPPKPVLPLVPRPLAVTDTPSGDYEFLEVAVCESNLAVILAEFGDGRLDWAHESLFLAERATSVIDQIVWRYEKDARRLAAKMLSSGKAILPELPEEEQQAKEAQSQSSSGHHGGGGSGGGAMVEASVESGAHAEDESSLALGNKSGGGAEEHSDNEKEHDEDEDDEKEDDEATKALLQRREALYVEQKVATCLDLNVRVAQIVARHNKLRVLRREARPSDAASTGGSHEESSSSGFMDSGFLSPGQEGSITSAFTEGTARFDRVNTNPKIEETAAATAPPAADGSGEATTKENEEEEEEDIGTAMEAAAKAERAEAAEAMVLTCFEIFESAPADAVAKAQSDNPKLTPYIGLERLDTYPPPEFEAIFAARRQAELDAIALAKQARKLEKQARKEAKLKKIAAKKAKQDLKDDPFNIDLIEAAGFVERAKQLRAREAKRARMLEQWHERKALEDHKKAARLLKQMNQERITSDAAAEAAALRQMPRNISSATGKRPVS